jgi:alpha-N-arabinofuranosidase
LSLYICSGFASDKKIAGQTTTVSIEIPDHPVSIDPMIYGQMLEDCNDKVIYGGLLNDKNEENPAVFELLKSLRMPVVRWPAGTYIHEYDWENGIGPKEERPVINCIRWGGYDNNLFGTDEFLQWCQKIGTEPYINFNMSNHPDYAGSLGDALNWIEYVNGTAETAFGMQRVANGRAEPYNVKYWCIGNENYGSYGIHKAETAEFYAGKLYTWASTIKSLYPELSLLGVGHVYDWNKTVLEKNGDLIDFLAAHYYMGARMKDGVIQEPFYTLFSPIRAEMQISKNALLLDEVNRRFGRTDNPVRLSVDEWNCRHEVFSNGKYAFTRNDDRRQFDIVTIAGMLNVFVRQCKYVGMANYIFPVNGHGLIRSVGEDDAYRSTIYYVFDFYRKYMIGKKMNIDIKGATATVPLHKLVIEGNMDEHLSQDEVVLPYVDGTAVMIADGIINIALINRSHETSHKVKLVLPEGYIPLKRWTLESDNINAANTEQNRANITPQSISLSKKHLNSTVIIPPCGFTLVQYKKASVD